MLRRDARPQRINTPGDEAARAEPRAGPGILREPAGIITIRRWSTISSWVHRRRLLRVRRAVRIAVHSLTMAGGKLCGRRRWNGSYATASYRCVTPALC